MARLGLRSRLFLSVVLLFGVIGLTSGWWVSRQIRQTLVTDVETFLTSQARTLAQLLPPDADLDTIRTTSEAFAEPTHVRLTVVARDGRVLADSEVDDVSTMDNHGSRPEIVQAYAEGEGTSMRYSTTVERHMLYVAVPWPAEAPIGVVRASRPLTEVEAKVRSLTRVLWLTGIGGLFLTLLMAAAFSQVVTRDLRELTVRARNLARTPGTDRGDEIAWISGSIDRLATELRSAVDGVAEERNRLSAVLAGMREAVVAVDRDGVVELINPAARSLLGLEASDVGLPMVQALGSPVLVEIVQGVLESGAADEADLKWAHATRPFRVLDLLVTVTPQVGAGAVIVAHDVSELRRLEAIRRDFVANVSHELRTPVAVIQSSSEALLGGASEDPVHGPRFVEAIARHAGRLGALISDLLDLAKIESGRQSLELARVDVRAVVADAVDPLTARAEAKDQEIAVDVQDGLHVRGDLTALRQVLANLIENAIKYTPEASQITVGAAQVDGFAEIWVADDGPGISDIHHTRIFERFYRVDPGRSRDMGGTGLGLAIVRHLVEVQGGTIRVEHNIPRGARFVVTLPMA